MHLDNQLHHVTQPQACSCGPKLGDEDMLSHLVTLPQACSY